MRNGWWTWWQTRENAIGCLTEGVNICPHLSLLISCCVREGETEIERSEITNGFRREAGLRCPVFLAHQSSPLWLIGGSVIPSSVPPTRESVTVTGSPLSVLLSAAMVYAAHEQNVWVGVLLSDVSIPAYLRKVCVHNSYPCSQAVALPVPPQGDSWQHAHHVHGANTTDRPTLHKTFTGGRVGLWRVHKNVEAIRVWNGKMKKVCSQSHLYLSSALGLTLNMSSVQSLPPTFAAEAWKFFWESTSGEAYLLGEKHLCIKLKLL